MIVALVFCAMLLPPPLIALSLKGRRPDWSKLRVSIVSAAAIPTLLLLPAAASIVDVKAPTICGDDGCRMVFAIVELIFGTLACLFFAGLLTCALMFKFISRKTQKQDREIFE